MPMFKCRGCFKRFKLTESEKKVKEDEHRKECEGVCHLCNKGYMDPIRKACTKCGRDRVGNQIDIC